MLTMLLCFVTTFCHSQQRNLALAKQIAADRLSVSPDEVETASLSASTQRRLGASSATTSSTPFYIFNHRKQHAFVIVSGDVRMKEVLGVSEHTEFRSDSLPCGLETMLAHYADQYNQLTQGTVELNPDSVVRFTQDYPDVPPLLSSEWGQESPYNDNCPSGCPSGCVATAMGQIMRFYAYPETGRGSFTYISATQRYRRSYDFANAHFDWASMKDHYGTFSTGDTQSRAAVANLLEACGVAVGMDYAPKGSGALDTDVSYALIHFFGYNPNTVCYARPYFKTAEWYEKVQAELQAGRPILYCGQDSRTQGGHAFIVEGYRRSDGKYYVNWGWNGDFDGYYELDALNPSRYRFSASQSMIARFCPDETGEPEDIFGAESFAHTGKVEVNKRLNFTLSGVYNFSNSSSYVVTSSSFTGKVGIALYDADYHFMRSLAEEKVERLRTYYGFDRLTFTCTVSSSLLQSDKTYYIVPYVQSKTAERPTPIRTLGGKTDHFSIRLDGQGGDDTPPDDETGKEEVLEESFESSELPKGWNQEYVIGKGDWTGKLVLMGDDTSSVPVPADGKGYAYISYNSGTMFADTRTITRLQSPLLVGKADKEYVLDFQCRKYTAKVGTSEILSILIDRGGDGEWEILSEQTVTNANQWLNVQVPYTVAGTYRLAFEGSIEPNAFIFVDDVKVSMKEAASSVHPLLTSQGNDDFLYTLTGVRVTPVAAAAHPGIYIQNGKKIIIQ